MDTLVLREAFYGARLFDGFERGLGAGRNVLTQRLARLAEERILVRTLYQDRPARSQRQRQRRARTVSIRGPFSS